MKKRLAIFALAATAVFTAAHADDYGVWLGASVQKNITKQFSVDAGLGMRAENKLNDLTRYDFDAGLGYKITLGLVLVVDMLLFATITWKR